MRPARRRRTLAACAASLLIAAARPAEPDPLLRNFRDPPEDARPQLWWHWIGGNITPGGIAADLDWMHQIGIGGVHLFDVDLPQPKRVDPPLRYMSPPWVAALRRAMGQAHGYGMTFGIAGSPGWSESGAPWVPPADAMKKLAWSEVEVRGGHTIDMVLPPLPGRPGPLQDAPPAPDAYAAAAPQPVPLTKDVALLAMPADDHGDTRSGLFSASFGAIDSALLTDGKLATGIAMPAGANWIEQDFARPVTIRSAVLGRVASTLLEPADIAPVLEADSGVGFRTIAAFTAGTAPQQTLSFAAVSAKRFRLRFASGSAATRIAEFRLSGEPRVNRFEDKAGFGAVADPAALGTPAGIGVSPSRIVDLSDRMAVDGHLHWRAPPGRWRLVRLGWSLIGQVNHPAVAEATGLEVDKLDAAAVGRYVNRYLDRIAAIAPLGTTGVDSMTLDSIEVGSQNWTPSFIDAFRHRRGYDPLPFLPAMTGIIVGDAERSDRFLFDVRRTIGELLAKEHYGTIARIARNRGLTVFGEAMEFARTIEGDDMAMRTPVDVPMSAMWAFAPDTGPEPTAIADMRGAASVAHLNAKPLVAAELLTSIDALWRYSPADLRPMIDRAFAAGINRPIIHSSVHQPDLRCDAPGLTLGVFGQTFNRCETWAVLARPWMDYVARTAFLLRQGDPVADLLCFAGEDAPLVAQYGGGLPAGMPRSNGWDFVDVATLINGLRVDHGQIIAPGGARYRVLWLDPASRRMTLPTLRRLAELVRAGATIAGAAPRQSPSLGDDPAAFRRLADAMGSGMVSPTDTPEKALSDAGVRPRYRVADDVDVVERRLPDRVLFFVANHGRTIQKSAWFAVAGRTPELWHAEDGSIVLPSWNREEGGARVALDLPPGRSVFVVFHRATQEPGAVRAQSVEREIGRLFDWTLTFPGQAARPAVLGSWTTIALDAKRFSGTATYAAKLWIDRSIALGPQRLTFDLGGVGDVARVFVNGREAGIVWEAPWRLDVTGLVHPGRNAVEVRITNLWTNHLGGAGSPRLSGLFGPVRLLSSLRQPDRKSLVQ